MYKGVYNFTDNDRMRENSRCFRMFRFLWVFLKIIFFLPRPNHLFVLRTSYSQVHLDYGCLVVLFLLSSELFWVFVTAISFSAVTDLWNFRQQMVYMIGYLCLSVSSVYFFYRSFFYSVSQYFQYGRRREGEREITVHVPSAVSKQVQWVQQ